MGKAETFRRYSDLAAGWTTSEWSFDSRQAFSFQSQDPLCDPHRPLMQCIPGGLTLWDKAAHTCLRFATWLNNIGNFTLFRLLVTWCTNKFNIQQLYALATLYLSFVFIWNQTATCATYSINWLVFIIEMKCLLLGDESSHLWGNRRGSSTVVCCMLWFFMTGVEDM
jgi:hypothetical protein